jgi:hypothetical protein
MEFDKNQKSGCWGSVSANGTRVTLDSDWRDMVEEGYAGVEGLGSGERAVCKGGGSSAKNQKLSRWGSVLANETQWLLNFDWVDVDCEGYTVFEGLGLGERAAHGRGPRETRIRAIVTRFLAGSGLQRHPVKSQEPLR